ncbi:AbrB/MazE/SpoVT family DNA-binding domain-containing protein [Aneurinibacillus aneurinilyticus]|jgi:transcriptional pleiotropic regulator of transition state genes|uniref:AbrB/MazE/SpoVT family DNA-binding domain-containing protein n=2 Tax=Aneurinibacillus aneurinilyticus TaxID=1391 RepID=A0A848CSM0_ANEAE|nr:AbrB/MazE/SpoVT family DNA-binding domain-containing protein [Aneurinibacillus aneurinilyticus]ERI08394.1 transition state transcriptional regulatory protein AbrB family protein [Aneurinibacillus aneurinilyticus ATCC 12856]MCI1692875.1 AbrB/MazE/SpoVT family DNA-binding domain-containing protein [Aneurinibacillus aneurinilyticus]MED0669767.1 AbrB/MazE/SpoVT family DNA-binding domain-containing protein [Aneurinibacillus aneurinilyticus]MED0705677.1 AbrB/MazE/SpoVT family DNA-binding domain-co
MNETGIVRELDNLGRIVFPMEVRKKLGIHHGDGMEIFVDGKQIILQKYTPGCIFCDSIEDISEYKGRKICDSCLTEMKNK